MIDHTGLLVSDIERAVAFYEKALAPLGYEVIMRFGPVVGLGVNKKPDLWLSSEKDKAPTDKLHIAFRAPSRSVVKAFYEAAMAAGGRDNGPPGVREMYHPDYFGAFVLDPDGHNIEAVCHEPYLG
jgi:catechol 2,3-dioxygenase-like lactoylglutathione lyase family enzyme